MKTRSQVKSLVKLLSIVILIILLNGRNLVFVHSQPLQLPYLDKPKIVIDGVVSEGEYPANFSDQLTGIDVYWVHNGSLLFVALSGSNYGWTSIGFGSTNAKMDGSNIVICSIDEKVATVVDEVGIGHGHYPDISRGGESNIIKFEGMSSNGTTIEFILPLDSGDSLDYKLTPGESYGVFLAQNNKNLDFTNIHSSFSNTYIFSIEPAQIQPKQIMLDWKLITLIIVLIPITLYVYWRKNRLPVYRFSEMHP